MLNRWDNLDRHVERGYAGASIWDWHKLPDYLDPRYIDYARANASIGIKRGAEADGTTGLGLLTQFPRRPGRKLRSRVQTK